MVNNFQKHWPSLLGALFLLTAFVTLLKYSMDQHWISDEVKIGIGLLAGAGFVIAGMRLAQRQTGSMNIISEVLAGLGVAILYTTCSFAGIFYSLWDSMIVLISMTAVTAGTCLYAIKFNSRILMSIGLIGAIIAPIMMQPATDQVFSLFLYLLVINAAFFYISVLKKWFELRLIAFIGSWLLYAVYFILFNPQVDGIWSLPFRYALAAYAFYIVALFLTSWKERLKYDGLNLYLGIANAIMFGLWALALLHDYVSFSVPLLLMGVVYILAGALVYRLVREWTMPIWTKMLGGSLLVMLAASQFGSGWEYKPLISVYVWLFIAAVILIVGMWCQLELLKLASVIIWFVAGLYWYTVTWHTPRGEWFGTFVPFLNWGAVAWMALAAFGFYISLHLTFKHLDEASNKVISYIFSIGSHIVVGGLLPVQMNSLFGAYRLDGLALTLSISWGIYALLLFLWGAYSKQAVFRIFGSIVLIVVALKTLFFDLANEATIYKVIVFLILGAISFAISYINSIWQTPKKTKVPQAPDAPDAEQRGQHFEEAGLGMKGQEASWPGQGSKRVDTV